MLLFVSEAQAGTTPSVMACGRQVFEIMLRKDDILKCLCMFVSRVLQGSIVIT